MELDNNLKELYEIKKLLVLLDKHNVLSVLKKSDKDSVIANINSIKKQKEENRKVKNVGKN
jgi:hypothetical protein